MKLPSYPILSYLPHENVSNQCQAITHSPAFLIRHQSQSSTHVTARQGTANTPLFVTFSFGLFNFEINSEWNHVPHLSICWNSFTHKTEKYANQHYKMWTKQTIHGIYYADLDISSWTFFQSPKPMCNFIWNSLIIHYDIQQSPMCFYFEYYWYTP